MRHAKDRTQPFDQSCNPRLSLDVQGTHASVPDDAFYLRRGSSARSNRRFGSSLCLGVVLILCFFGLLACGGGGSSGNQNDNTNQNNNQTQALCGNGVVEGSEECDEGEQNSDSRPDACRTDCRSARCGDDVLDTGEECDHGAQNSDVVPDACRTSCQMPRCGDGVVDVVQGEGCDCGDGTGVLPGRCVMPNSNDPGASCRPGCIPAGCGDGLLQGNELCDGDLLGASDCQTFGFYRGQIACTEACSYDLSGCFDFCGDGVVNHASEACDGDPPSGLTCQTFGFDHGPLGCSTWCTPGFEGCGWLGFQRRFHHVGQVYHDLWAASASDVFVLYWEDMAEAKIGRFDGHTLHPMTMPAGTFALQRIRGVTENTVFAVGSSYDGLTGYALQYDGVSWTDLAVPSGYALHDVWPLSGSHAVFVGKDTAANRAVALDWNAGVFTATLLPGLSLTSAGRIWGFGPNVLYAGGHQGLARFNGTSWAPVSLPESVWVDSLWGSTVSNVFVGGRDSSNRPCLYRYNGTSWSKVADITGSVDHVLHMWGSSDSDVFLSTDLNDAYHFDGAFWTPISSLGDPLRLGPMSGTGPKNLFARANSALSVYGGHMWSQKRSFPNRQMSAIAGRSAAEIYTVGIQLYVGGLVWQRVSDGWTELAMPPNTPVLRSAWTAEGEPLWVSGGNAGGAGHLMTWTNFWTSVSLPHNTPPLSGLHGLAGGSVFAVGGNANAPYDQGVALRCTGSSCSLTSLPATTSRLMGVWAASESNAFAVGVNGTILRFNGTAWTAMSSPAQADEIITGVWGRSPSAVWAVTMNGRIFFYDGSAWSLQQSGTTSPLRAIWGRSASDVFATGAADTILHFDGAAWSPVRTSLEGINLGIWGTASAVWFVGYSYTGSDYASHIQSLVGEGSL